MNPMGLGSMYYEEQKRELFACLAEQGAKLMGVADLSGLEIGGLQTGVAVAVPVPPDIVRDLQEAPTKAYYDAYYALNDQLNAIVRAGAAFLIRQGYRAMAQTTDVVRPNSDWCTPLPHKTVATRAGLGWIGKSCLLVTPTYGSAVRLSSLVTDAPLPADEPIQESRCGGCMVCVKTCPAGAIYGTLWHVGVQREELFAPKLCKKTQIQRMQQATGIETDLCGRCFAVCPYTQRYLRRG